MEKTKLKLINVREENYKKGLFGRITQPPLCLASLAAMIPEELPIEVEIIDEQIEPIDLDVECDVAAFSVTTHIAAKCYTLAEEFRKRGKKVIMGGYHVKLCPEEAQQHADSILIGEAEEEWPIMLRDFVRGELKERYESSETIDLKKTPIPRRDLLKLNKYIMPNTVIATRGCPYSCSYCSSSKIYGKFRRRKKEEVIAEIKALPKKRYREKLIVFVDDELFGNRKEAIELFKELEKLKIEWFAQSTVPALFDKELMQAAARSGCAALMVGVETLSKESTEYIKKYQNFTQNIDIAVEYVNKLGIPVGAMLIAGLDTDTPESLEKTVELIDRSRFLIVNFSTLRAYPGLPIYNDLLKEGRVIKEWWLKEPSGLNALVPDDMKIYFKPKHFTRKELLIKTMEWHRKLNSIWSIRKMRNVIRNIRLAKHRLSNIRVVIGMLIMNFYAWWMLKSIRKAMRNTDRNRQMTRTASDNS